MGIRISGIGAFVPNHTVSNHDIAKTVDTTHEWISSKTGILERRITPSGMATSDLAVEAGLRCLENAGIDKSQVSLIVVATSSPDQIQPAVACLVQEKLGLSNTFCPAFDVNSVCAGFIYALNVAQSMMLASPETYQNVLVIGAEAYSRILDWEDRRTCVFFGDGAGAVLLSQSDVTDARIDFLLGADGSGAKYIGVPAGGTRMPVTEDVLEQRLNKFYMDGPKVWEFAVATAPRIIQDMLSKNGLTVDDLDCIILHQANLRMIEKIMDIVGLPFEKTVTTVETYGNTAAASVPITLQKAFAEGKLRPGSKVMLVSFGGGLSWGAALLTW
jgi:3-oxoacyl-[acyl-carrier-protein] synthase-3